MDKWDKRFMQMAFTIADWSSCYRAGRSIGCVIVKDKRIMTTGYNGAPAGIKTCRDKGECMRDKLGIPSGTRMETCYAVHAEQNAIVQAAKLPGSNGLSTRKAIRIPLRWSCLRKRAFSWKGLKKNCNQFRIQNYRCSGSAFDSRMICRRLIQNKEVC